MSRFETRIVRVNGIEPIEGADAIEVAVIGEYRTVVRKGDFTTGDVAAYICEGSIVPQYILEFMNLVGRLSGPNHDRVKAIKLRGVLSQGLLIKLTPLGNAFTAVIAGVDKTVITGGNVGDDIASELGITKYEPVIPAQMSGQVYYAGTDVTVAYDIENYKKWNDKITEGEVVFYTEKLHGTFTGIGLLPYTDPNPESFGDFVIFSKGQGADGICFKNVEANENNVYIRAARENGLFDKLRAVKAMLEADPVKYPDISKVSVFIFGETFGSQIQDLGYGERLAFRAFDICYGFRGNQRYVDAITKYAIFPQCNINQVPVVDMAGFNPEHLKQLTTGKETLSGKETHIREGVVVTPAYERYDSEIGRVILKSVSGDYLTRKNGSEYQ